MTGSPRPPDRRVRHERIAAALAGASDDALLDLLTRAHASELGHAVVSLPRDGGTVFVKLVPITSLELSPHHRYDTSNLFGLPTYYQYRIGSCGFGAWRELEVHRITNEWVTSGQCGGFPLLHHWRILPVPNRVHDDRMNVDTWRNCPEIRGRVSAIVDATDSLVLFLEHIPFTLDSWLRDQLRRGTDPAALASQTETKLRDVVEFVRAQGVLHLDAHEGNILSDGDSFYLTDYGLAMSREFDLSAAERSFFDAHHNFDVCTVINSLVRLLVIRYDGGPDWRQSLRLIANGSHPELDSVSDDLRSYLRDRAPLVVALGDFYRRLLADLSTPYPAAALDELLQQVVA